jgi:hypothetical protein
MSDELKRNLDKAKQEFDKAYKNAPLGMDLSEYKEYFKTYEDNITIASLSYRMAQEPKFRDIPKYGDRMLLDEFIECCNDGGFIDYDGSGNYVKDGMMSDISIYPSDVKFDSIRKDFDEIVWFNR